MSEISAVLVTPITVVSWIVKALARTSVPAIALLLPLAATAEPITLKLSFFASEQSDVYRDGVKPFVDAVNAEGKGLVTIKVYPKGMLGNGVAQQPNLVAEGVADIAWVVPGQTPYRFPDNQILEMPSLLQSVREGTLVYTHLIAAKALRGYENFFVIGAYTSAPNVIHSRKPTASLAALNDQKIRVNNSMEAEALVRFGAIPTIMPALRLADALTRGAVDAIVMSPGGLFQFGTAGLAANHYLLGIGTAPLLVLMNRKKFDSLPEAAQVLIRKYSGERAAATWIELYGATEQRSLDNIESDPARKAVKPSPTDGATAQKVFQSLIDAWAAKSPHNRELLKMIEADLTTIRTTAR